MRIIECKRLLYKLIFILALFSITKSYAVIDIVFPANNYVTSSTSLRITWNRISSFGHYELNVSTNPNFTTTFYSVVTTSNNANVNGLISNIVYYARIRGAEGGATTEWSPVVSFRHFLPSDYANQRIWLEGDNGIVQSGGNISSWNDQSGNGNNAVQASPTLQPKVVNEALLNNKPTVKLDGDPAAPDFLQFTNDITDAKSIFIVAKHATGSQDYAGILGQASDLDFTSNTGTGFFYQGGQFSKIAQGEIYANKIYQPPYNNPTGAATMLKPTRYTLYRFVPTGSVEINHIASDRKSDPSRFWNGSYAELIAYADTLDSDKRNLVEDYLLSKYAPRVGIKDTVIGTSFCTPVTLTVPNNYTNYTWSTGSSSALVNVPPNTIYWLKTRDVFNMESITYFNVFPYVRLGNKKVYICKGDTLRLDLKLPAGFSALWSTGNATQKQNITTSGQYTVTITDGAACSVRDTVNVIVDDPQLNPNPDVTNNLRVCFNEKLFLTTATAFDSIRWSTGSTNTFIPLTAQGTYSVSAVTSAGCVLNRTFNVTIIGNAPTANFSYSAPCEGTAVNFTDLTSVPAGNSIQSWKWTFSNGTTSGVQNPTLTFPGLGLASAALKVTTNVGCTDSIFKSFAVNKKPQVAFDNRLSCAGNPTVFVDQTVPNSAAVTDWSWNFSGLGLSNGIQNPSFRFPSAGSYNVRLVATNSNGCVDSLTKSIIVNASPNANFSNDLVCGSTPVTLKFLATVDTPSFIPDLHWGQWEFGDGTIETAIRNPQHVYASPGTYDVTLIVYSSNNCVDTIVKPVKVFDYPIVDFAVSETQCTGKEIQFTDLTVTPDGTPINKWNWFFSGQATDTIQNPRYTFNAPGNYTIQLTAKNEVGCSGTKLRSIAVTAPPTPRFTFSPQNGLPPLNVNYINQSPVSGNYTWSYGDGSPLVNAYNPPQHVYTAIGSYPIKLIASDFRGCTDTLTKYILVDKAYLDGVMTSITIIPDGDFYKIQATIFNNSNIEITALGLSLQLGGGSIIRENWTGSLLPGQTTVYLFTGEIKLSDNNQVPVVCASIDNVNNNAFEDRTDNNSTCKEVKVGNFDVFNVYPNPATEGINFSVMLPKDGKVNIRFIDALGQLMYNKDFDGVRGYNSFAMPTAMLNSAVYIAEVSFDGEIIRKKFMRKDRK